MIVEASLDGDIRYCFYLVYFKLMVGDRVTGGLDKASVSPSVRLGRSRILHGGAACPAASKPN